MDMSYTVIPRSDQLNADDLIAGPRTVTITRVNANAGNVEQPVNIFFEGDTDRPFRPCKSMRRVLIAAWGADAKAYAGRSMTLYCDPKVKWGGMLVGGVRISHLSHIERDMMLALTETKGSRKPFTVKPLVGANASAGRPVAELADEAARRGLEAFRDFWKGLGKSDRTALQPNLANYQSIAKTADEEKAGNGGNGGNGSEPADDPFAGQTDADASSGEGAAPDASAPEVTIPTINVATATDGTVDLKRWHADAMAAIPMLGSAAEVELFQKTYAIMIKRVGEAKRAWGVELDQALTARSQGEG